MGRQKLSRGVRGADFRESAGVAPVRVWPVRVARQDFCRASAARYLSALVFGPALSDQTMPYIITEACIGVKDKSCVDVCPVDCIYEGPEQLYIHPDECIDCGACEPECPVTAIFPEEDVPANQRQYIQINRDVFKGPNPPGRPTR
jgi:NAD-dependent dihydropyrimidine dehydrogenase PreA subunit